MSRPRFLANHDLTEAILLGVVRREPGVDFQRLREVGMADRPDADVLNYAAELGLLLVSHDVNTMTAHASERIAAGLPMPGLFLAHQHEQVGVIVDDLVLIWLGSDAEEWEGQVVFLPMR